MNRFAARLCNILFITSSRDNSQSLLCCAKVSTIHEYIFLRCTAALYRAQPSSGAGQGQAIQPILSQILSCLFYELGTGKANSYQIQARLFCALKHHPLCLYQIPTGKTPFASTPCCSPASWSSAGGICGRPEVGFVVLSDNVVFTSDVMPLLNRWCLLNRGGVDVRICLSDDWISLFEDRLSRLATSPAMRHYQTRQQARCK